MPASFRDTLIVRMRELSLVDLGALLGGLSADEYRTVITSHIDEMVCALREARREMDALRKLVSAGGDPLEVANATSVERARDNGEQWAERCAQGLMVRAEAGRDLARISEAAAALLPQLFAADRRAGAS